MISFKQLSMLFILFSSTLLYCNVDSMLIQQELPTQDTDELGFFVRFSVDEEQEQNIQKDNEELTLKQCEIEDVDMFAVLRTAFTGFAHLYLTLSDDQKDDLIKMTTELLALRNMVEEYCETCLKSNDLMLRYKAFKNVDTLSLHASIGCRSDGDAECSLINEMPFSMETFLQEPSNQTFLSTLTQDEQKQYKRIVKGMKQFCNDVVKTVEVIVDHYPLLKEKVTSFLQDDGLIMVLTISFDHPFPSALYQIM